MGTEMSTGLKATFLVHFVVAAVFGLVFLLSPDFFGSMVNWPIKDEAAYRLIGAAMLGYGASSWFAYRQTEWESVKIVVVAEIVWTTLGALVMLWGLLYANLPSFGWVTAILLAAFAVVFTIFYRRG